MGQFLKKAIFLIGLITFLSFSLPYAQAKKDKGPKKKCEEPKLWAQDLNYDWVSLFIIYLSCPTSFNAITLFPHAFHVLTDNGTEYMVFSHVE